jgi:hypothetical protein
MIVIEMGYGKGKIWSVNIKLLAWPIKLLGFKPRHKEFAWSRWNNSFNQWLIKADITKYIEECKIDCVKIMSHYGNKINNIWGKLLEKL